MALRKEGINIPLLDLKAQYLSIREEIDQAIARVHEKGNYVMGDEVKAFEEEWAKFCGAKYAVGVSSGTDALYLALLALREIMESWKVGENSPDVLIPAFTFPGVLEPVFRANFFPRLADVDEETACLPWQDFGDKVAMPTALYGQAGVWKGKLVIEDLAQAHGCLFSRNTRMACHSFYPSKNLGAYGQAGAVVTNDLYLADLIQELRTYGERERFIYHTLSGNYRMDELQAAVLRAKLPHLRDWNEGRWRVARAYNFRLAGLPGIVIPGVVKQPVAQPSVYHIYAVRVTDPRGRDSLARFLVENGIQTAVRYPMPLHLQPALAHLGYKKGDFPNAEAWARTNLSLPIWPEMSLEMVEEVAQKVKEWAAGSVS